MHPIPKLSVVAEVEAAVVLNRLVKDLGAFLLILKYLSPEFYDCPEGVILLLGF